ncbi:MAG: response regulator transcription factor [Chloroflexi bacterium]|nr:response regulator transcription factor [Chloroflexota bacterium]
MENNTESLPKIKVMVVEDHTLVQHGIIRLLESDPGISVMAHSGDAKEAITLAMKHKPDVVLLDIQLNDGNGIDIARWLQKNLPETKAIILSAYDFDQYVNAALKAGVKGYLLKDISEEDLIQAIYRVYEGGAVLQPHIAAKVLHTFDVAPQRDREHLYDELTIREIEVLALAQKGLRNSDIAQRLGVTVRTIEVHMGNVLAKMQAKNRTEAIDIAVQEGLLPDHSK